MNMLERLASFVQSDSVLKKVEYVGNLSHIEAVRLSFDSGHEFIVGPNDGSDIVILPSLGLEASLHDVSTDAPWLKSIGKPLLRASLIITKLGVEAVQLEFGAGNEHPVESIQLVEMVFDIAVYRVENIDLACNRIAGASANKCGVAFTEQSVLKNADRLAGNDATSSSVLAAIWALAYADSACVLKKVEYAGDVDRIEVIRLSFDKGRQLIFGVDEKTSSIATLSSLDRRLESHDVSRDLPWKQVIGKELSIFSGVCRNHSGCINGVSLDFNMPVVSLELKSIQLVVESSSMTMQLVTEQISTFYGQPDDGRILSVAFHPSGSLVASGGRDGMVRLWTLEGEPAAEPPFRSNEGGHGVWSVAFHPRGGLIASGGSDGTVRLWTLEGEPAAEPFRSNEGEHGVWSVAFHPRGGLIASGGSDGTVRLWTLEGEPAAEPFRGHDGEIWSVAFHPSGQLIASGGRDGTVRLWTLEGEPAAEPFRGHEDETLSVAFHPRGGLVASGGSDGTVRLWTLEGEPAAEPFQAHAARLWSVAFHPSGQLIASGGRDGTVRLWTLEGEPAAEPFRGHEDGHGVWSVAFHPRGGLVATGGSDGTVRLWTPEYTKVVEAFPIR